MYKKLQNQSNLQIFYRGFAETSKLLQISMNFSLSINDKFIRTQSFLFKEAPNNLSK